ncbi:MAG: FecR domain-containing protein [Candidatus Marinimicrobia bacterium]|nr:FecR domain-containing protein [Candidatus Neomarinimicrobiota bacterium]
MFIKKILFIIISLFIFSMVQADTVARVIKTTGDVLVKSTGQEDFATAVTPGMAINNGDHLKVGETGFAVLIYLDDKSVLKVRENSEFQFVETENTRTVDMKYGTIYNQVAKEGRDKAYRVQTPTSVASVKGTEFWALVSMSGIDQFMGTEGLFEVLNQISGQVVQVAAGQTAISNSLGNLMNAPTNPGALPEDPDPDTQTDTDTGDGETEDSTEPDSQDAPDSTPDQTPEPGQPETEVPEPDQPEEGVEGEPGPESAGRSFGMGLGIGSVTIDGQIYNQFALRPEFSFGKLGIGLDVVLYIDDKGNIREEEWDEASDFIDKFLYVRWAEKKDPFWFKLGALNSVTLGYGGLLSGYSNMMEFPSVRRIGVNMGVNMGKLGTELLLANVKDLARGGTLAGLRTTYKVSKTFPLTVGLNVIADLNQFSGLKDKDDDSYPDVFDDFVDDDKYFKDSDGDGIADEIDPDRDNNGYTDWIPGVMNDLGVDSITAAGMINDPFLTTIESRLKTDPFSTADVTARAFGFGFDLGYPVFQNKFIGLDVYTEFNHLQFPSTNSSGISYDGRKSTSGSGITIPGVRANILKSINLMVEYRIKQDYFVSGFFDQSYDLVRVLPFYDNDGNVKIRTRDMQLFADSTSSVNASGYFGSASADILNIASFSASYANMKADTVEFNSFFAQASINTDFIPKLSIASAYYMRNNDENPFDFGNPSENTILGYKLGYEVSKGVSLIWDFRQFYRDTGGEELEPVKMTTIETAFSF